VFTTVAVRNNRLIENDDDEIWIQSMSVGTDRDRGLLIYGGFALSLAVVIGVCRPWNLTDHFMVGAPFGRDFVNFWMGGRLALEGRFDLLADLAAYNALIVERFGHSAEDFFVFSYPPSLLAFLVPFGALPYLPALIVWTAINLALLAWSTSLIAIDRRPVMAACLSPAAMIMVTYGHFSGALAALAIFALTRGSRRPVLAGMCLALISVKPQFAATLGLLMLLIGQWRAVAWSLPGAAAVIGVSILAFGLTPWMNFFNVSVPFHSWLIGDFVLDHLRTMLSIYGAARLGGLSFVAAQVLQVGFGLAIIAGTAMLVRRAGLNPRTLALLLLAAIAALAYFQHYDLAIVAPALSVALFGVEPANSRPFLSLLPASLLWLAPPMAIPFGLYHWPVINLVVAGVLAFGLVTRARRECSEIGRVSIEVGTSQSTGAPTRSSTAAADARSMQGSSA
jgi:alpha-1,2-mannosyltransferase